jgi:hypothetical protein
MRCKYPNVGSKAAAVISGVMRMPGYLEDSPKPRFHSGKNKKLHLTLILCPSNRVATCYPKHAKTVDVT